MKEYAIEYMSIKDKGWIHYSFFDTIDEAKASLLELAKETDGDAFTKEFRIVKEIDINNKPLIAGIITSLNLFVRINLLQPKYRLYKQIED